MEWLKAFSTDYANAVTAIAAIGALLTALVTLLFLKREYRAKYRPYVVPLAWIQKDQAADQPAPFAVFVEPKNVGPHPCRVKITDVELQVGDDLYPSPSQRAWTMIGPTSGGFTFHCGSVHGLGITNIQQGRYRTNRVELRLTVQSMSAEDKHQQSESYAFEIDVRGAEPVIFAKP